MGAETSKCWNATPQGGETKFDPVPDALVKPVQVLQDTGPEEFDCFISHKQSEAQDAVGTLIFNLKQARPSIKVWLDLEQNPTEQGMEDGVKNSKALVFYCTENIAFSKYCLLELGWAIQYKKRIILVAETDPRHGATEIGTLRDRMPDEMKHVFDENVAIPYYRDPAHRAVSIQKMLDIMDGKQDGSSHGKASQPQGSKKEPVLIAAVSSSFLDTAQASTNAFNKLMRELKGKTPTMMVCNCTCNHDCEKAHATLSKLIGSTGDLLGCTSSTGVIVNQSWHSHNDKGFGLFGIYDPDGLYEIGHAASLEGVEAACKSALQKAGQDVAPDFAFIFPTPGMEESVLQQMKTAVGGTVPVIGGSSADNSIAGEWKQFSKSGGVSSAGCVFALCWPSVLSHAGFCSGFGPTQHTGKITKLYDKRHVATIDGEKAAVVYNRWSAGALSPHMKGKEDSNILAASTLTPLGVQYGTDLDGEPMYVVIHPHLIKKKDMSFTTFKDVEEGQELVCLAGTRQNLVTRISKVSAELLKSAPFKVEDVIGSYQIFCGGVMMAVKDDMPVVVEKLGLAVDWKPTMGACTFGEQGTFIDGTPGHGNLMFASLVFSRIKKSTAKRVKGISMQQQA